MSPTAKSNPNEKDNGDDVKSSESRSLKDSEPSNCVMPPVKDSNIESHVINEIVIPARRKKKLFSSKAMLLQEKLISPAVKDTKKSKCFNF